VNTTVEHIPARVTGEGVAEPTIERPGATHRRAIVETGRVLVIFVPIAAVIVLSGLNADFVLTGVLITSIWYLALRFCYQTASLSPFAVGFPVVSAVGTTLGLVLIPALSFWIPVLREPSLGSLFAMATGVFATSTLYETVAVRRFAPPCRILILGNGEGAQELRHQLMEESTLPFELAGPCLDYAELGGNGVLLERFRRAAPDIVVLSDVEGRAAAIESLLDAELPNVRVVGVPEFYEHAFGRVPVRDITPIWFMSMLHLYRRPYSRATKRLLDLAIAVTGLVFMAPLFLVVALAVKRSGAGPIILRQTRLGERGKPFEVLKFRTMIDGAEEPGEARWAEVNDPRVTRVGHVLRRTRFDELPQLWNVLRGEMSAIGPRPERPEFLPLLRREVPFWGRRHLVKPGITGWAQVNLGYAASPDSTAEKLSYDLYYLKNRSLVLDLAIVVKTVVVLISGWGAR
jgi:exopolysaccharide biosynthesis polyprenyl glycosylphosphotransferase